MPAKKSATTAKKDAAPKGRKSNVPENETKQQKFKRLAEYRMNKWLNYVPNILSLATYPHEPEQGAAIVAAAQEAVDRITRRFSAVEEAKDQKFSL